MARAPCGKWQVYLWQVTSDKQQYLHLTGRPSDSHSGAHIESSRQDALVYGEELEYLRTVEKVLTQVVDLSDLVFW